MKKMMLSVVTTLLMVAILATGTLAASSVEEREENVEDIFLAEEVKEISTVVVEKEGGEIIFLRIFDDNHVAVEDTSIADGGTYDVQVLPDVQSILQVEDGVQILWSVGEPMNIREETMTIVGGQILEIKITN